MRWAFPHSRRRSGNSLLLSSWPLIEYVAVTRLIVPANEILKMALKLKDTTYSGAERVNK